MMHGTMNVKECGFRVIDSRVLKETSGSNRDEVTGNWEKSHNVELHGVYLSPYIIRVIK
jgi:hypothetical protein